MVERMVARMGYSLVVRWGIMTVIQTVSPTVVHWVEHLVGYWVVGWGNSMAEMLVAGSEVPSAASHTLLIPLGWLLSVVYSLCTQ